MCHTTNVDTVTTSVNVWVLSVSGSFRVLQINMAQHKNQVKLEKVHVWCAKDQGTPVYKTYFLRFINLNRPCNC